MYTSKFAKWYVSRKHFFFHIEQRSMLLCMLVQTIVELQIVLLGTHADILSKYLPKEKQCLELFARNLLPGWTSWGNEVM